MTSQQLSKAVGKSARRLASQYLPYGYRGPIIGLPAAIRAAKEAKGTAESRYHANG